MRAYVARGRQLLLAAHRGGASGTEVVRRRGAMMDGLLGRLFEHAERDYATASRPSAAVARWWPREATAGVN